MKEQGYTSWQTEARCGISARRDLHGGDWVTGNTTVTTTLLIEAESEEVVKDIAPDFTKLMKVPMRGVIVTAKSKEYDFVSRFFAPEIGLFEDPVTGSAHCCLGPFWRKRLGKEKFNAYQLSERGGRLKVQVAGERVLISGKAVTIIEGNLLY